MEYNYSSPEEAFEFSEACLQMNTTILIKLTRRNIKLNKSCFCLWNPMTTRFIMQTLIYIIGMEFLSLRSRRSSSWKHPQWRGVTRNGCFCRLHLFSVQRGIQPKMRPTHLILVSKCWSASQAKGFCNSFCIPVVYTPRWQFIAPTVFSMFCQSIWEPLKKPACLCQLSQII